MGLHAGNRSRPAYSGQARYVFPREVIELFRPRKPLEYHPPVPKRRLRRMTGLADLVGHFESREAVLARAPPATVFKPPAVRRAEAAVGAAARVTAAVAKKATEYDPFVDTAKKTLDAFNTLFVGRIPKATTASELRADFEKFGTVVHVAVPKDRRGLPRGYAFIEFLHERDLKIAFRQAKGRVLRGHRIVVDVERARTVKGWLPNRLDGPHNSAARAARKIIAGRSKIAAMARAQLAKADPSVIIERERTPEKEVPDEVEKLRFEQERERPEGRHNRPGWDRQGGGRERFNMRDNRDRRGDRPRPFRERRSGGW